MASTVVCVAGRGAAVRCSVAPPFATGPRRMSAAHDLGLGGLARPEKKADPDIAVGEMAERLGRTGAGKVVCGFGGPSICPLMAHFGSATCGD